MVNMFGNSTILLVIEMLIAQQDYRTINVLSEDPRNELLNKIIRVSSNSFKPTTSHSVIGGINMMRIKCEQPVLNVVLPNFLNHLNNESYVDFVRANIFPDDITLLLPHSQDFDDIHMWINLCTKIVLLTENLLTIFIGSLENEQKINLFPFDMIVTRNFIQNVFSTEYYPSQQSNFTVFFQYFPPKSSVGTLGRNLILIGPDGSVAQTIVEWLRVQPIFSTDIAFSYPDYLNWLEPSVIGSRMHYQSFYPQSCFDLSVTESIDLHLSPYSVYGEDKSLQTESLYPHEKDCMVVIVPKQLNMEQFLEKIIRNPDIQSIFIALMLFTVTRIIIEKSNWKHWFSVFIKSLGIFLNQDKMKNDTSTAVAWEMNLRGFSVLATIALSVIIFKNLMSKKYVEIDTIDDLIASNLTIVAPDNLENDESFWSNLKPSLHKRITFKGIEDLNFDIVTRRKFNFAYVFTDSGAEYMDMLLHSYISDAKSYKRTIRIMHENLYCTLSSYRISKKSPLKRYVNDFLRRFVENGLYDKHLEWIRQLNRDVFQVNKYKTSSTDPVVLDIDLMSGIFFLFLVGVAMSVVVFVFELKV